MKIDLSADEQKNINALISKIKAYKVIPVIGYELYHELSENRHDNELNEIVDHKDDLNFFRWFSEKFLNVNQEKYKPGFKIEDINDCDGMDYINRCYHVMEDDDKYTTFGEGVKRIHEMENLASKIPAPLAKLARIMNFRFFIDTTVFRSLESAITTYRLNKDSGKNYILLEPDELNPGDEFKMNMDGNDDYPLKFITKPVIWNFFGNYDDSQFPVYMTDTHMQEVLYRYIRNQDKSGYVTLQRLFSNVDFLFIGCTFKDWIFRFILRFIVGDKLDNHPKLKGKYIVDEILKMETDPSRNLFIGRAGIQNFKMSPSDFVDTLYEQILLQKEVTIADKHSCKIFISFAAEDRAYANCLKHVLETAALDCFLDDKDIDGGDMLSDTIKDGIDNCSVFVPIVSNNFNAALGRHSYVIAEWSYALQNHIGKDFKIMPVFIEGYHHQNILKIPEGFESILNPGGSLGTVCKKLDENMLNIAGGVGITIQTWQQISKNIPAGFISAYFLKELKNWQEKSRIK